MLALPTYQGVSAVYGLGRSGLACVAALAAAGNHVRAWDDAEAALDAARDAGAEIADLNTRDTAWEGVARLVLAPGIPPTHPVAVRARASDIPVIGDMALFADARRLMDDAVRVVAITGTNGKSTTTALVAHILNAAGYTAAMGGNIGVPVLTLDMPDDPARHVYVLELSSFQIDLAGDFAADVAVLTNLAPDHLDRYGDMEAYAASKAALFRRQPEGAAAVFGCDGAAEEKLYADLKTLPRAWTRIAATHDKADIFYADGGLHDKERIADLADASALRGVHNGQNAAAALGAARALGVSDKQIAAALTSFGGLAHRLQPVGQTGNVAFVNDSKATNAGATRHALAAYDNIYWIAGGRAKSDGLDGLENLHARIRHAYLIGEAADGFAATLGARVAHTKCGTLAKAVHVAASHAHAESTAETRAAVVLLSPACASFDQFENFEARGDAFCAAVAAWQAEHSEGAAC